MRKLKQFSKMSNQLPALWPQSTCLYSFQLFCFTAVMNRTDSASVFLLYFYNDKYFFTNTGINFRLPTRSLPHKCQKLILMHTRTPISKAQAEKHKDRITLRNQQPPQTSFSVGRCTCARIEKVLAGRENNAGMWRELVTGRKTLEQACMIATAVSSETIVCIIKCTWPARVLDQGRCCRLRHWQEWPG